MIEGLRQILEEQQTLYPMTAVEPVISEDHPTLRNRIQSLEAQLRDAQRQNEKLTNRLATVSLALSSAGLRVSNGFVVANDQRSNEALVAAADILGAMISALETGVASLQTLSSDMKRID